jgi:hypothetical protein
MTRINTLPAEERDTDFAAARPDTPARSAWELLEPILLLMMTEKLREY